MWQHAKGTRLGWRSLAGATRSKWLGHWRDREAKMEHTPAPIREEKGRLDVSVLFFSPRFSPIVASRRGNTTPASYDTDTRRLT